MPMMTNKGVYMDNARAQQIWDHELLSSWDGKGSKRMSSVINGFLNRVNQGICRDIDDYFKMVDEVLNNFELKRCLDIGQDGNYTFRAYKSDVIGFIQARSETMSTDLISGTPPLVILIDIKKYKWKKLRSGKMSRFDRNRKQNERDRVAATQTIKARELNKKHDWGTVK